MSALGAFLAGRAQRSNPEANAPRWRVESRRAEGGAWEPTGGAGEEALAREEVLAPLAPRATGDLVRLLGPDGATAALWVTAPWGAVEADPLPARLRANAATWVEAWEGPEADAAGMAEVAGLVPPRLLARAVLAVVVPRLLGAPPPTVTALLGAVRRWAGGARVAVGPAVRALWSARTDASFDAVGFLGEIAAGSQNYSRGRYARDAVVAAIEAEALAAGGGDRFAARRAAAPALRAVLSLPAVLLARAGEDVPAELGG